MTGAAALITNMETIITIIGIIVSSCSAVITTVLAVMMFLSNRKTAQISCLAKDDENIANLIICNSGNKSAKNIKFKVSGSLVEHLTIDISKLNFVALAPGENFTYEIGQWPDFFTHGDDLDLIITSYYDGLFNRFFRKTDTYTFSLQSLSNSSNVLNWNRRFHRQIENTNKNIGKLVDVCNRYVTYVRRENQKKPEHNFSQRIEAQRIKRQKRS